MYIRKFGRVKKSEIGEISVCLFANKEHYTDLNTAARTRACLPIKRIHSDNNLSSVILLAWVGKEEGPKESILDFGFICVFGPKEMISIDLAPESTQDKVAGNGRKLIPTVNSAIGLGLPTYVRMYVCLYIRMCIYSIRR